MLRREPTQIALELLVIRAQAGDERALAGLVRVWHPRLVGHAQRLMPDEASALDAVQEAWLSIARSLRRLDDPARFRAWAFRVVSNKCADAVRQSVRLRRSHREHAASESSETEAPVSDAVRGALRAMDTEKRAMLALHYVDGLTVAELAEVFAVPQGTVKSRLYHARNQLRALIERNEP